MLLNKLVTYGKNFWVVILPAHILGVAALYYVPQHFVSLLVLWFLIGVVGNGVAAHRYFAHNQFETYSVVRWVFGLLATLGAIGPLSYWMIQHRDHHVVADSDRDTASPARNSMWYVIYEQMFRSGTDADLYLKKTWVKRIVVKIKNDPVLSFFNNNHFVIIHSLSLILLLINPVWCLMYWLAISIEFLRIGCINWYCHRGTDSGYRNHESNDNSSNNYIIGWLGMGFGWHNNHHANPKRLILTDKWWEIDIEGYIGYLLRKR